MAEATNQFSSKAIAAAFCFAVMGIILTEGQQDFLAECRKKLVPGQCGWQIGNELYSGNATVDQQCCSRLVDMGEKCHKELLKNYLSSDPLIMPISMPQKFGGGVTSFGSGVPKFLHTLDLW